MRKPQKSSVPVLSHAAALLTAVGLLPHCSGDVSREFHSAGGADNSGGGIGGKSLGGGIGGAVSHSNGGSSQGSTSSSNGGGPLHSGGGDVDSNGGAFVNSGGSSGPDGNGGEGGGTAPGLGGTFNLNQGGTVAKGGMANGGTAGKGGTPNAMGGNASGGSATGGAANGGKANANGGSAAGGKSAAGGATGSGGMPMGSGGTCSSRCSDTGTSCTNPNQCKTGMCVDGMCCESTCGGACEACSNALTGAANGTCAPVKNGTDPGNDCATDDASTCQQTGLCNANRACALYGTSTVCKTASCASGSSKSEQKCDGAGTCKAATTTTCSPFICGTNACLSECAKNADCASGMVCIAKGCKAHSDLGGACDETADCTRGDCFSQLCGLSIKSIRLTGVAVDGGGSQIMLDGWFKTDSAGHSLTRVSSLPAGLYLHSALDVSSTLTTPLPPNNYLVLTGAEGSNPLERTFQFNLSDGTSVTKTVQASDAAEIVLSEGTGDPFMLFQWTGSAINVLPKVY